MSRLVERATAFLYQIAVNASGSQEMAKFRRPIRRGRQLDPQHTFSVPTGAGR